MLVQWGTQKAQREKLECFSACMNDAKTHVCRILERAERSLRGCEAVLPGEDLGYLRHGGDVIERNRRYLFLKLI